jgi:DNA polymerase III subunit gamma/tau
MSVYRALARKYRSRHFGELIGQPVLVQTLSNAIEQGRLHHAYMFTGIRGTGKTSTARILAKAINYAGPNGDQGPTTGPTDDCLICQAIGEDRHPDVIEIDAASNTGVDDVRQIIENVRYAPVQARYKVFIIDEVHMLSKAAFNALLKTLEEPPPHVVFMLATTEIRKVPTTILSRCQRFDLRRIDVPVLVEHYKNIAAKENVTIDEDALYMIAQAADGSVRDGLSIFDQAIAQSNQQTISMELVQSMLGQANAHVVGDMFMQLMQGEIAEMLQKLGQLHQSGIDPSAFLDDLLNINHLVTRVKLTPALIEDKTINASIRESVKKLSEQFTLSSLSRVWQMLLKAVPEVANAPQPQQALEMALIRVGFASTLPPLEELLKKAEGQSSTTAAATPAPSIPSTPSSPAPTASYAPSGNVQRFNAPASTQAIASAPVMGAAEQPQTVFAAKIQDFAALVKLCEDNNEPMLAADLYSNVRVAKFAQGQLQIQVLPGAAKDLISVLPRKLREWTGDVWLVSPIQNCANPTLSEQAGSIKKSAIETAYNDPAIVVLKTMLPNIKITNLTTEEV